MCRGVVEDFPIDEIEVVAFEEEEEEHFEDDLPDGFFDVEVGEGIFVAMDIDDYNDFLLRQQEEAYEKFIELGYDHDINLFQQL